MQQFKQIRNFIILLSFIHDKQWYMARQDDASMHRLCKTILMRLLSILVHDDNANRIYE